MGFTNSAGASCTQGSVHPHIRGVYYGGLDLSTTTDGPSPHTWGLRLVEDRPEDLHRSIPTYVGFTTSPSSTRPGRTVHPHIRGVYTAAAVASYVLAGPSPHTWGLRKGAPVGRIAERSIPTYVGFTLAVLMIAWLGFGPSPHTWGLQKNRKPDQRACRSIPTYVGFTTTKVLNIAQNAVHPHIRGVYFSTRLHEWDRTGPSPHTWGLRSRSCNKVSRITVHPHIRGVYTEIKSKISRASSKTALLPAEKFKILFLVKIKSSAAAFQVHTIFRDQFPPGLHFEIALHL